MLKVNVKFTVFLLFTSSGFFLTTLGFSPVYPLCVIGVVLSFFHIAESGRIRLDNISLVLILSMMPLLLGQSFRSSELSKPIVFNYVLSVLVYLVITQLLWRVRVEDFVSIIKKGNYFYAILLLFEFSYRVLNPSFNEVLEANEDIRFYAYKVSSLMFKDSNAVGILLLHLFFLNEYYFIKLREFFSHRFVLGSRFIYGFLVFGTLSRAAIVSLIFGCFVLCFIRSRIIRFASILILPVLFLVASYYLFEFVSGDSSGKHKLMEFIFLGDFLVMKGVDLYQYLFGIGFGFGSEYVPTYIHSFVAKIFIEGGVVLACFILSLFVLLLLKDKRYSLLILPVFLSYMSFSIYVFVPFTLAFIALIQYKINRL